MRRWLVVVGAVAVAGAGVGVGALLVGGGDDEVAVTRQFDLGAVESTDLVRTDEIEGTLGFGTAEPVPNHRPGIVTAVPEPGDVVPIGAPLYDVDDRPVLLLRGDVPAWRPLGEGTEGADVRQLEATLVELGHATEAQVAVDEEFTAATAAAVERLQEAAGVAETGRLELGDVVFAPSARRVAAVLVPAGASAGPNVPVVSATGSSPRVRFSLEAADAGRVTAGDGVEVVLPGDRVVAGTVADVGRVATAPVLPGGGAGQPEVEVEVTLGEEVEALDGAPVTVRIVASVAEAVLAVPVRALLALSEGGYAVEVAESDGTTRLVGVEIGVFVDARVEVRPTRGELTAGDRVVLPARS